MVNMTETYNDSKFNENGTWCTTGSGYIELFLLNEDIENIAQSGDNLPAVQECLEKQYMQEQIKNLSDEDIEKQFKDIGLDKDPDEIFTKDEMLQYIIWDFAWNEHEYSE